MNQEARIEELERALQERARRLADEYLERGRRSRDHLLADAKDKLHLREEREVLSAKTLAARRQKRLVQAGEIRLQGDLDRLRWALIESVLAQARERLRVLAADKTHYPTILVQFVCQAAAAIGCRSLTVHLNQRDHQTVGADWPAWCAEHLPDIEATLAAAPIDATGGARVESADQTIRVDNTFEGRTERLQEALHRVTMERLFASVGENGGPVNG